MRRLLVIFLILLFPLNVLALSLSASSMQQECPAQHALSLEAGAADVQGGGDIDPDEPPASGDFHETVDAHSRLRFAVLPGWSAAPYAPPTHVHPSFAPIKPPPRG